MVLCQTEHQRSTSSMFVCVCVCAYIFGVPVCCVCVCVWCVCVRTCARVFAYRGHIVAADIWRSHPCAWFLSPFDPAQYCHRLFLRVTWGSVHTHASLALPLHHLLSLAVVWKGWLITLLPRPAGRETPIELRNVQASALHETLYTRWAKLVKSSHRGRMPRELAKKNDGGFVTQPHGPVLDGTVLCGIDTVCHNILRRGFNRMPKVCPRSIRCLRTHSHALHTVCVFTHHRRLTFQHHHHAGMRMSWSL